MHYTIGAFARSRPKFLEKFRSRTLGHGEETLLSLGWTSIGSELSSPNINSSVRVERSSAIRYFSVVIKHLCGILDICENDYFRSRNSVRVLSVTDRAFGGALAQLSKT